MEIPNILYILLFQLLTIINHRLTIVNHRLTTDSPVKNVPNHQPTETEKKSGRRLNPIPSQPIVDTQLTDPGAVSREVVQASNHPNKIPGLVNLQTTMERSTIFHRKIHYFRDFQVRKLSVYQRVCCFFRIKSTFGQKFKQQLQCVASVFRTTP